MNASFGTTESEEGEELRPVLLVGQESTLSMWQLGFESRTGCYQRQFVQRH